MNTPDNWLKVLLECNRRDHSATFSTGDQRGPTLTSRAFAIALRAMSDAYYGAGAQWPLTTPQVPYLVHVPAIVPPSGAVAESALHGAATTSLLFLYPKLAVYIQEQAQAFGSLHGPSTHYGRLIAEAHISSRIKDGHDTKSDYTYAETAGAHQSDPETDQMEVHGSEYGRVASFLTGVAGNQILLAPPPGYIAQGQIKLNDPEYEIAVIDVMKNGHRNIAETKPENALIGIFWAYDGANLIGTPPRLYLQIIQAIADANKLKPFQEMLLYSAAATAMGESGIQAWHNKYHFNIWRPAIGVREHDNSMGRHATPGAPGNPKGNAFWSPLGAPRSNNTGKNFTPDFPAYPSGHATFGAASLHITQLLLENILEKKKGHKFAFSFVSDECNGVTKDVTGNRRSRHHRKFASIEDAYIENGVSRVYLGVHWRFDSHVEDAKGDPIITPVGDPKFIGGIPLGLEIANRLLKIIVP